MSISITEFTIEELWGYQTFKIPIKDNKLVLVGENGTGKSTIANLIFFLLTFQLKKINQYDFKEISLATDQEKIVLSKKQLNIIIKQIRESKILLKKFIPEYIDLEDRNNLNFLLDISTFISEFLSEFSRGNTREYNLLDFQRIIEIDNSIRIVKNEFKKITKIVKDKVLYLPTYRRIEQDLKAIFPDFYSELYEKKISRITKQKDYVELVEFGMEDVEQTINRKMDNLKNSVRNQLENLIATVLKDLINKIYQKAEVEELKNLDNETVESIFSRIDEKFLPEKEKKELRDMLEKIKNEGEIEEEQKVTAHFLIKLLKWHKQQQEQEKDIRSFINVCNNYLVGKQLRYDNINLRIYITLDRQNIKNENNQKLENEEIELKMLSSGEKQIVSLFSHLYLSDTSDYFVIIDEPELSLSVPWQKRFLPDILHSGRCNGLIAVTHSPFIFDNELDSYTHSLTEFISQ
ncbi:MAG: AAA family ATPase [Okeania sp. SIO2C9]|uniref:AAA family ATPase n=1 Tax=Okeania sp. SIO2C9 TaxID=2607791 RepID=UPI0013C1311F|nr:AAA family ATPase [Okeania sp. SIO2C9]NEQ71865.1 AAA family ATPase [Okeania sp. SIO2C9]